MPRCGEFLISGSAIATLSHKPLEVRQAALEVAAKGAYLTRCPTLHGHVGVGSEVAAGATEVCGQAVHEPR